uniref:Uncharacterized protein n=1 Tax=Utricularia reniformis TaxID=192314 RepID=A0A1Y0B3N7_9LAMI|nr:hypothetical protein AEK19_MT0858 [Utricularia reniformis]YP_009382278.1 hypothetical protein AEK19_MT1851 [Utricularia reniformis]ART31090.1 hypothetical protein AEK19_MT0858 [Utricularia reniformis]ART32021.1 hypothetical protein AEK19_MT1851 [Utricularia reniformis]
MAQLALSLQSSLLPLPNGRDLQTNLAYWLMIGFLFVVPVGEVPALGLGSSLVSHAKQKQVF